MDFVDLVLAGADKSGILDRMDFMDLKDLMDLTDLMELLLISADKSTYVRIGLASALRHQTTSQ